MSEDKGLIEGIVMKTPMRLNIPERLVELELSYSPIAVVEINYWKD